jgi:hypothetical protein
VTPHPVHRQFNNPYNTTLNMPEFRAIPPKSTVSPPIVQPFLVFIDCASGCPAALAERRRSAVSDRCQDALFFGLGEYHEAKRKNQGWR